MSTPTMTEPGGDAARVRCLYCGANNFPASPTCWQCKRPLKAAPAGAAGATGLAGLPPTPPGVPALSRPPATTDTALAPKAAAALGLMFPYVGLPVGIVFLMLDDPRKAQIGWTTIGWSVFGTILNAVALGLIAAPLLAALKALTPHGAGGAAPSIPGVPDMGGDGTIFLFPWLLAAYFAPSC